MKQIEQLFATEVWLWKYLSIRLPPTAFADEKASEDLQSRYVLNTNFDELDEVARDESGKQKVTKSKSANKIGIDWHPFIMSSRYMIRHIEIDFKSNNPSPDYSSLCSIFAIIVF